MTTTRAPNWRPRTCRAATAHDLQWLTPTRAVCIHPTGQCCRGVWLFLCSAVAVGGYIAGLTLIHALHVRVTRQEQAAAPPAPATEGKAA